MQEVTLVSLAMMDRRENPHLVASKESLVFKVCMDPEVLTEFPAEGEPRAKRVTLERCG